MVGCGIVLLLIGAINIGLMLFGGYTIILMDLVVAVIFVVVGAWMMNADSASSSGGRSGGRDDTSSVGSPEDGFLTFDPETGEEQRIWNGRYYHKVRGRWEELPPRR